MTRDRVKDEQNRRDAEAYRLEQARQILKALETAQATGGQPARRVAQDATQDAVNEYQPVLPTFLEQKGQPGEFFPFAEEVFAHPERLPELLGQAASLSRRQRTLIEAYIACTAVYHNQECPQLLRLLRTRPHYDGNGFVVEED